MCNQIYSFFFFFNVFQILLFDQQPFCLTMSLWPKLLVLDSSNIRSNSPRIYVVCHCQEMKQIISMFLIPFELKSFKTIAFCINCGNIFIESFYYHERYASLFSFSFSFNAIFQTKGWRDKYHFLSSLMSCVSMDKQLAPF